MWSAPRTRPVRELRLATAMFVATFAACGIPGGVRAIGVAASPDGFWMQQLGEPAPARYGHAIFYDAARNRLVVFGGARPEPDLPTRLNDVWVAELGPVPAWRHVVPAGTPPAARQGHTMVYDSARDRLLVLGGADGPTVMGDVWSLSLAGAFAWNRLETAEARPPARWSHSAAYDRASDRMIVFGGVDSAGQTLDDAWALSLSGAPGWSALEPAGERPSARQGAAAVVDPARRRLIVHGGSGVGGYEADAWALSLDAVPAWTLLAPSGTAPGPRAFHTADYDARRDRIVFFGGIDGVPRNDAWTLDLSGAGTWTQIAAAGAPPSGRYLHAAAVDAGHDRLLLFAGTGLGAIADGGLWSLALGDAPAWTRLPDPAPFPPRKGLSTILDPARRRLVVFGGYGDERLNDVWTMSLADRAWGPMGITGTPPTPRAYAAAVHDPEGDRMIVFGGYLSPNGSNAVWELAFSPSPRWTQLFPAGTLPAPRFFSSAILDPVRQRMIVYGGYVPPAPAASDVWALSLAGTAEWTRLAPQGEPPPARYGHCAIYDPVRDRMIVYGGQPFTSGAWALEFTPELKWVPLTPDGPTRVRTEALAAYDPVRDRMLVHGGSDGTIIPDLWELSLPDGQWRELHPEPVDHAPPWIGAAVFDPERDELLTLGVPMTGTRMELWALSPTDVASAEGRPDPLAFAPAWPNPARGTATLSFSLPSPGSVALRVFDVGGRRVRTLLERELPAGEHVVRWNGRTGAGDRVPAGLYFCELAVGSRRAARRLVLLD